MRRTLVLVAGLALASALWSGTASAAPQLDRATFLARADAVCLASAKRIDALIDAYPADDPTAAATPDAQVKAFAPVLTKVIAQQRAEIAELRKLVPPKRLVPDWKAALDAYALASDTLARAIPAARKANRKGMTSALQAAGPAQGVAGTIARSLGLRRCGSS